MAFVSYEDHFIGVWSWSGTDSLPELPEANSSTPDRSLHFSAAQWLTLAHAGSRAVNDCYINIYGTPTCTPLRAAVECFRDSDRNERTAPVSRRPAAAGDAAGGGDDGGALRLRHQPPRCQVVPAFNPRSRTRRGDTGRTSGGSPTPTANDGLPRAWLLTSPSIIGHIIILRSLVASQLGFGRIVASEI